MQSLASSGNQALSPPPAERLDYGHSLEFAYFLVPDAGDPQGVLETARRVDELGYDLVAVQDHPYQPRHLDTMSLLAAIAGQTASVRLFADVTNLPLRPPAVLAKAAATLDLLSGGRFELGLGAGGFQDAIAAMGGPRRSPREALESLEEAIGILRLFWSGERSIAFSGRYYSVQGLHPGPPPAHPIGIWVGAVQPRMLGLVGRLADGWAMPLMNYMPAREAAKRNRIVDRAARAAGRDPAEIRRVYLIPGALARSAPAPASDDDQAIVGPPEHWADVLTHFATELGVGTFVLAAPPDPPTLTSFIEEVAPQVRERVAERRAADPAPARADPLEPAAAG
jgi:alkanesulfonate monooxygenase SsuD/methylene tetrahydromethanopterin reductase-like flavin-dependent oxidoreductase (luciferase family)